MSKIQLRLIADVVEKDGQVSLSYKRPDYYQQQVDQLRGKKQAYVTITTAGSSRSLQQNRYLWGVIYPILAEATGYTNEEIHEWSKSTLLPPRLVRVGKRAVYITKSTTALSVGEMSEYVDKLIGLAEQLDCIVPTMEEAGYISNYPHQRLAKKPKNASVII